MIDLTAADFANVDVVKTTDSKGFHGLEVCINRKVHASLENHNAPYSEVGEVRICDCASPGGLRPEDADRLLRRLEEMNAGPVPDATSRKTW